MSCFTETRVLASPTPDPTKHVNFVRGMVLGEDEFKQEFAWLSGRDQWLARDLIGYGTVRGLKVQVEQDGARGPRIYVHPGAALTPAGQLVCVPSPQCANLNDWLRKNAAEVELAVASPPQNPLSVYVVLCYRECLTDKGPIPGEPCRSEGELLQPLRVRDGFGLDMSLTCLAHREERALRRLCERVREVDMTDETATSPPLADFLDWLRRLDGGPESPPASPPGALRVNPNHAAAYLRAAFHLWTTELRPKWFARWYGCAPESGEPAPLENCVLLAEVQVPLVFNAGEGAYQATDTVLPTVSDADRPYVLHLRMLQEWLIGGASRLPTGAGSVDAATSVTPEINFGLTPQVGTSFDYARADHTHGTPALPPVPNPATTVVDETAFGLASATGSSSNYARADHTHGTPALPPVPNPATTVADETTFGLASATGSSSNYARADHTHGTPALPPVPNPATTVVDETAFGLASATGSSSNYARADHTHGTPALPPVPNPATTVADETAFGLASATGSSSNYAREDHTHGTPALPPVPNPATTVVDETAFGLAPATGSSSNYARADHTHGTPALPPVPNPATTVVDETAFGLAPATGSSSNYAREDHTHGTPLPVLDGEVTGAVGANRVARLLNVPLPRPDTTLQDEQFLAFRAGSWVPAGYVTVAAGQVTFPLVPIQNNQPPLGELPTLAAAFGGLTVAPYQTSGFLFTFPGFQFAANYIVKLTPWAPKSSGAPNPFAVYFKDFDRAGFFVTVWVDPNPGITEGKFMIEVNQVV